MKVSFALLCHNETDSLKRLLDQLVSPKKYDTEIVVVQDDKPGNNSETNGILANYYRYHGVNVCYRALNNDFAAQKNYMTEQCTGEYIVNPDSDELLPNYLLENIHLIIEQNKVDVIWVPRINTVEGLTDEWTQRFGWRINEKGWVNWPDPQSRIYKNDYPNIRWENKVHERIVGFKTHAFLPREVEAAEHVAFIHKKTIDIQIQQNAKYDKILGG